MTDVTLIDPDDLDGLIPRVTTRAELDEHETRNILDARLWLRTVRRRLCADYPTPQALCRLHGRMFGRTWRWAGRYRGRATNLGFAPGAIPEAVAQLCADVGAWIGFETYGSLERAARFHHRLVRIHPFVDGNGRHARLAADLLMMCAGERALGWGPRDPHASGDHRDRYIAALRAADEHDHAPLLAYLEEYRDET